MLLRTAAGALALAAMLLAPSARAQTTGASNTTPPPPASQTPAPAPTPATPATIPATATATPTEKKHAKHVYTDDDFSSPSGDDSPSGPMPNNVVQTFLPKDPMTAKQLADLQRLITLEVTFNRAQTKESIAKLYLRTDDVAFRGRDEFDQNMFEVWTEVWKSMEEYTHKLAEVQRADAALFAQGQLGPGDLAQLQEQRKQLIEEWGPSLKLLSRFSGLQLEASEKAAEWRKYNSAK
jgi:hypothetical protein